MARRWITLSCTAACAAAALAGCGGGPSGERPDRSSAVTVHTTTTAGDAGAGTRSTTAAEPRAPKVRTLRMRVRDGFPVGGPRTWKVRRGQQVEIVVRADAADEVHLHGYDIARDVRAGTPARIGFRATRTGAFELELERTHTLLATIEVRP